MTRPIAYMMSGQNHCPYLLVSLLTLRRVWDGPIIVYAWPDSIGIVTQIAKDPRLGIYVRPWHPKYEGKNSQFESKILMVQSVEAEAVMYLDADTIVNENPSPLFDAALEYGFAATRFNNWVSTGKIVRGRIRRLEQFDEIPADLILQTQAYSWPSVNGGVFCCRPQSEVLPQWHEWTVVARSIFISDETVLHILQPKYVPDGKMIVVEEWNDSPKYNEGKWRIMHGHGDSFLRCNKSGRGVRTWWPLWQECLEENVGNVQDWAGDVAGYKWMNRCVKQLQSGEFRLEETDVKS